jgi:RNA polymerase sigma factor
MSAKTDPSILEELIRKNEIFILKIASKVTSRYITKSDDEWSIALLALTQAIEGYELEKGNFLKFAELVIKRRIIDYIRSQGKFSSEVSIDPVLFDAEPEEEDENIGIKIAVAEQISKQDNGDLKLEIEAANQVFSGYGFSFFDLTSCSPQAKKTRTSCAKAVNYMLNNPFLITELKSTKLLPIKIIEKNAKIPRKILERHRKYIIAAIELLSGGYPYLADYLRYIREEDGR